MDADADGVKGGDSEEGDDDVDDDTGLLKNNFSVCAPRNVLTGDFCGGWFSICADFSNNAFLLATLANGMPFDSGDDDDDMDDSSIVIFALLLLLLLNTISLGLGFGCSLTPIDDAAFVNLWTAPESLDFNGHFVICFAESSWLFCDLIIKMDRHFSTWPDSVPFVSIAGRAIGVVLTIVLSLPIEWFVK